MQKGLKKYFVNMDEYLTSLGFYRKMVARDASSLFRAVSEQLYYSQNYHQRIRQDCADFMRANKCNFEPFVEGSFEKYLERLEDPKETVGQVEIKALSQLYRRCFLIYRYPGKPATIISMDNFVDKVTLCCSINGHYDIVYPRSYPATAALCQSILYELLYIRVFGVEEAELSQATEAFRLGGRRYRNSLSMCSDMDIGYDVPETHRDESDVGGAAMEDKHRAITDDVKHAGEAPPPPARLSLPYKVLRSLDAEVYRNVEFDVWQDTCKEMQKTEYMVFAGRQYFLGDKCQVRLEPKGKYYNAFIQEVGTHSSAVTVFIEELGEKHLVPLTDLKPVNPVPAWNVAAPTRKGELDLDSRGQRHHRHRFFRKSRGSNGVKGAELLITQASSYGGPAPSVLPPRFQPAGHPRPAPPPGAIAYDPYAPPPHHPTARPPRYGAARSSTRFLNRHLIGPQLTYYHPSRRYCHDYDNYGFRSRRSRRQLAALDKESQYGFSADVGEEPPDLDPALSYYQLDDGTDDVFTPLLGQTVTPAPSIGSMPPTSSTSYMVARGSRPLPAAPPPGNTPVCSSDDDQDTSTVEDQADFADDYIYMSQDQGYPTPGVYATTANAAEASSNQNEPEGDAAHSPKRADMSFSYTQQVVKPLAVICSSPSSSSSPSSPSSHVASTAHHPPSTHTQSRSVAMAVSAASPSSWFVSEVGETLSMAPPPYSYDPNGSDLPRDCRVLQYYFNLGVQWYHQTCWQQQQQVYPPPPPESPYTYQHYSPYLSQEPPLHAPPSYPETGRPPHQPASYPEASRAAEGQTEGQSSGPTSSMESSSPLSPAPTGAAPSPVLLYSDQAAPPPLIHLPYEAPPPPAYLPAAPPAASLSHSGHPHPALLPHHSYMPCVPTSTHWGTLQTGHAPRVYCPTSNPHHVVSYIPAPPLHHGTTHYIPPTM